MLALLLAVTLAALVRGYQLAMVATLLPFATLGGIVGHRRAYLCGLIVFTIASAVCAFAWSLPFLVAAPLLQGLGVSAIMSVNTALISAIFPKHRLGRGVGLNSLIVGIAFAVGPTIASIVLSPVRGRGSLFKRPTFALSAMTAVCSFAAQGLAFVSLPLFSETALGRSQVEADRWQHWCGIAAFPSRHQRTCGQRHR